MYSNRVIAKNTLYLYVRMFLNMGISLYTSRIVLSVLGVNDYGIYALVAGVIGMLVFLNVSLHVATQRYLNYEKAFGVVKNINKIFNISLYNHVFIALVVVVLAEIAGVWFLNNKLNIPHERMHAANILLQMSIATCFFDIMRTPFSAVIIAYEKMSFFAFMGIYDTLVKLFVAYSIRFIPTSDKLILYGLLYLIAGLSQNFIYLVYCRKKFREETSFKVYKDFAKTKELLSFSSWMLLEQVGMMGSSQGLSVLLNTFYGVAINAALGIANQVSGAIYAFVSNFQTAFKPQIIQTYATQEYDENRSLILNASKYSFFLLAVLTAPVLYFTNTILYLWLGNDLPPYVNHFIHVIICCSLIDALSGPFWLSATAIGSIQKYQVNLSVLHLCVLLAAYVLLKLGYNPVAAYWSKFFVYIVMYFYRYHYVNKHLKFDKKASRIYFVATGFVLMCLCSLIYASNQEITYSWPALIGGTILIEIILLVIILVIGVGRGERKKVYNFLRVEIGKRMRDG